MYVWVFRDKGSEWRTVSSLLREGPRTFYPLVEAVCEPFIATRSAPAKSPVEVMNKLGTRLQLLADAGVVSADLGNLRQMFSARDRIEMLRLLRRAIGPKHRAVVPVVRCSDEPEFVDAACRAALDSETGLCVRADGLTNAHDKARIVSEIIDRAGIPEHLIDFVADAQDLPRLLSHEEIVALFPIALRARSWTVVAGAFPPTITHLSPDDYEHHLERSEWLVYAEELERPTSSRSPQYGDYATQPAIYVPSPPFRASPTVRYSTGANYVVLRGRGGDGASYDQFVGHARYVITKEYFEDVTTTLGDGYTRRIATGSAGSGNAMTWRIASLQRHVQVASAQVEALTSARK
jgi:hypothetical protein